jgi:hypothetical protein
MKLLIKKIMIYLNKIIMINNNNKFINKIDVKVTSQLLNQNKIIIFNLI